MDNLKLNYNRLCSDIYQIDKVFQNGEYSWPGDWEGRALLAFCCSYESLGEQNSCMHEMINRLEQYTNSHLYFGKPYDGEIIDEQQLSGHSWYLRGLVKYAQNFKSAICEKAMKSVFENLYLPIADRYEGYPLERIKNGGVSGQVVEILNGWKLSSDIGCAYMCVDGLAHYYAYAKDERCKKFLDGIITVFCATDFVKHGFQTHTTLSCLRGILVLYGVTGDERYINIVKEKFDLYLKHGMTLTYENFNWFGREDSWTEPCAVVDSFILATRLYELTGKSEYLTLARRIWFNGLQFCQRDNGGAGPNTCVTESSPILKISMYEAPFCCTMRYAEGLLEYSKNKSLFEWNGKAVETVDCFGRRFIDDKLQVKVGQKVLPIFSCNGLAKEQSEKLALEIIF